MSKTIQKSAGLLSPKPSTKPLIGRALKEVPGFKRDLAKFEEQVTIGGYSKSTLFGYSRSLASFSLHFGKSPSDLGPDEINAYLLELTKRDTPGETYFKHILSRIKC